MVVLGLGGFLLYYFVFSGDDSSGGKAASGCDAARPAYVSARPTRRRRKAKRSPTPTSPRRRPTA
ncbi:MAG: hypothetical protein MZV63_06065 [Marinilabiliales bacterium]|nr:hypothetical protein [Marinilabiliales bacterium]